jgi:hypothetical protein
MLLDSVVKTVKLTDWYSPIQDKYGEDKKKVDYSLLSYISRAIASTNRRCCCVYVPVLVARHSADVANSLSLSPSHSVSFRKPSSESTG